MKFSIIICLIFLVISCGVTKEVSAVTDNEVKTETKRRPLAHENGKFFNENGRQMLYGGRDSSQHFDITDYELINEQFHYGIGREAFPALLSPKFISISEADEYWVDSSRFLVAYSGNEVKAYSVKDLTRHEVINDELNGQPIMAAYCVLADLGAIYERNYNGNEITFALSGYTYFDENVWDGLDGFILWDRETESLWWPLIGKSVSGPLKDVKLLEMDKANWEDTRWCDLKKKFPNAQILKSGQDYERPKSWENKIDVRAVVSEFK